ncbi:MAG: 3D domain-containing protein [Patescibacteria group bacterium]|nr:3D domain-containing protein [Patescibacteria group bacterium]
MTFNKIAAKSLLLVTIGILTYSLLIDHAALAISTNPMTGLTTNQIEVEITAYSSTKSQTDDTPFIAASGKRVYDGMIAANFLPFGTKIKIPELFGDKIFTVDDRMNQRYQNRIDIWCATKSVALKFGIKQATIEIVDYSPPENSK